MSTLFKLSVACALLVGTTSLSSAKRSQNLATGGAAYAMDQQAQTGPYSPPVTKVVPTGPTRPYTWEEKRLFDAARGSE